MRSTYSTIVITLLGLAVACGPTWAAPFSFEASADGKAATATVDAFQDNNQAYVSLGKLMQQLGGSTREAPGKVTIDYGGRSAVATLNGTQVSTSTESFSLQFPLREADGGPYIAVADLEKLFGSGFGTSITRTEATAPEEDPEDDAEEPMEELLEEVAPAAPSAEAIPAPQAAASGEFLVVLDPGHGGSDTGIVSGGGANEKDVCLAVVKAVEAGLADSGLKIVLTRGDDKDLSVTQRGAFALQSKASLFVSVHTGASPSPAAHGFEMFVQGANGGSAQIAGESKYLAEDLEKRLAEKTGSASRGVRTAPMRALNGLNMPALIVELGMLTTPAEESLLVSADYQQKLAAAIAEAIRQAAERARGGQA